MTTKKSSTRTRTTRRKRSAKKKVQVHESTAPLRGLWLAGLGAVAATGEAASEFVDTLVEQGRRTEPKLSARAERLVDETRSGATRLAREVGERANDAFDGALRSLGVPERKTHRNVLHRLGDLAEAIL